MGNRGFDESPPMLGLTQECILERWPSEKSVKYRDVIECIRNALSHPLPQANDRWPRTGYTTQRSNSGFIEAFQFTHSPWVDRSGQIEQNYRASRSDTKKQEEAAKKIKNWAQKNNVENLDLFESSGSYIPMRNGAPFAPVMRVRLDVSQLRLFVKALSDYLSEPLRRSVEGKVQEHRHEPHVI